jgi:hypothetical protein
MDSSLPKMNEWRFSPTPASSCYGTESSEHISLLLYLSTEKQIEVLSSGSAVSLMTWHEPVGRSV